MIIINGCPRSATVYITEVLKLCGKEIVHETNSVGRDGIVSWTLVPTIPDDAVIRRHINFKTIIINGVHHSIQRPMNYVPLPMASFKENYDVLHQVRHPVKCITSMQKLYPRSLLWPSKFCNVEEGDSRLRMYMKIWYHWNIMAEKQALFTYRIEDLDTDDDVLKKFCGYVDVPCDEILEAMGNVSKKINTRKGKHVHTLEDLRSEDSGLCEKICKLAQKYGYDL